jgi:fatty acid desaturase
MQPRQQQEISQAAVDKELSVATAAKTHKVALQPGDLYRPDTAWPTLCLAAFALLFWCSVGLLGSAWALAPWATLPLSTAGVYMSFTPLHEACHRSVSRRHRWLNEAIGWACVVPFFIVPYPAFRWIHLRHHSHTNDPVLDPDHSRIENPLLNILSLLPNYVYQIACHRHSIDRSILLSSVLYLCAVVAALGAGIRLGWGSFLLQFWVLPAALGVLVCGLVFDYLPHHPHEVTRAEDLYGCTNVIDGFASVGSGSSNLLLTCLTFGQNYHAIHHLYPTVPFYAYRGLWKSHQDSFLKAGVPLVAVFR